MFLNRKKGFTLTELMIVMAIIAVIAVLGIVAIQAARRTARDTQRRDNIKKVQMALEEWYINYKSYPRTDGSNNAETTNNCTGIPLYPLFNNKDWESNTPGTQDLGDFITELKDPNGSNLTIIPTGTTCSDADWYARQSYRYKWASSSSYGIKLRRESEPCNSAAFYNYTYIIPAPAGCANGGDPLSSNVGEIFKME